MNTALLANHADMLIALSAAIAVFAAILVVSWPYFVRDHLTERMVQVTNENERIRVRERSRLNAQNKQISLRTEPKRLYKHHRRSSQSCRNGGQRDGQDAADGRLSRRGADHRLSCHPPARSLWG